MKNIVLKLILLLVLFSIVYAQNPQDLKEQYLLVVKRLEFAKDVEMSYPNNDAWRLLQQAEKHANEARQIYSRHRIRLAGRKIDQANMMITNALSMILNKPIRAQKKRLNEVIKHADLLILNSENQKARQFLNEAREHEKKAMAAFEDKNFQEALEQLRVGLFQANNAINTISNQNIDIQDKVQDEKQRIEQLKSKAETAMSSSNNPTAKKLYRLAEKQLEKTKQSIKEKNYSQAIEQYHQMTRLLLRVIDIASSNNDKIAINTTDEIIALDELIDNIQNRIKTENIQLNDRLSFLLDRIVEYQQNAHNAFEEKEYHIALFNLQMARNLIERALQIMNRGKGDLKAQGLNDDISQLDLKLEKIASIINDSNNEEAKALFDLAQKAKERAQLLSDRKRKQLSLATLRIAYRLADVAEQLVLYPSTIQVERTTVEKRLNETYQTIIEFKTSQVALSPADNLMLREAERVYDISANAFNQGFYVITKEGLDITARYLELISKK